MSAPPLTCNCRSGYLGTGAWDRAAQEYPIMPTTVMWNHRHKNH